MNRFGVGRPSRRDVLAGIGALGAGALFPSNQLWSQAAGNPRRLDLHHHFQSPRWTKRMLEVKRQGWQQASKYTPERALEAMDKAGVATALLSVTEPGVWFGDDFAKERQEAISLARDMNDFAARLMSDHKGRFGLFAVLPLPDIDASLREMEYAFSTLKADGVGLLTSYGNHWLGDPMFQPIFDELNRRNAVVYSHPTDAPCCHNLIPDVSPGTVEWNTDTARSIFSMINDGAAGSPKMSMATRYANIKFIWSHAGGSFLGLVGRFLGGAGSADTLARGPQPNSKLFHLRRFYYDTAQSTNPVQMQALKSLVGVPQIVFGSDFPYSTLVNHVEGLQKCGFNAQELRAIDRENAVRILPKYKT
jgi:predicted TIM-barrel fold metal-dependent hydrolase